MSAILTYSEWHRSICLAPRWAENWIESSYQCPCPSHSQKSVLAEAKLEMMPGCCQSSLLVQKQRGSAGAEGQRDKGLGKKHLCIFNLLTHSHCHKNKGLSRKTVTWKKGCKWLLNEMQIISLQVGKMCSCISINLLCSKLPTTGGRVWMQCILYLATAVNGVPTEMLKRHYLSQLSHDQEQFQNSKYFLILKLNWATVIFILQFNTQRLWETNI